MRRMRRVGLGLLLLALFTTGGCFLFPDHPPVAMFTASYDTVPDKPLVVKLDASGSFDEDGDLIVDYMWTFTKQGGDFEDGVELYPQGFKTCTVHQPIITVKYPVQGYYTVSLLVWSERNGQKKPSEPVSLSFTLPHE